MIENIISYQTEYLNILKEFQKHTSLYDDYLLLLDKVELLLKRNKKTITNFLELNKNDYLYYGGATYFDNYSMKINPIIFSGKKVIVADPIIKLSPFLKAKDFFDFNRIKDIIDNAIDNTIKLESKLVNGNIIYINPDDFIEEIKKGIYETARDITIQYLNDNLNVNYYDIDEFINEHNSLSFEELEKKLPNLNKILFTVDSTPKMSLCEKTKQNYIDTGMEEEKIKNLSAIEQVVLIFVGLFGQAFELKSISIILNCPLYITKPNVILYLNCIKCIDENDEKRINESNILFALYQVLKDKNTEEVKYNEEYSKIVDKLSVNCTTIDDYINELKKLDI